MALALLLVFAGPVSAAAAPAAAEVPAERVAQADSTSAAGEAELLEDDELERLAEMDEEPGPEIVGGALNNQELTYIVIALAAAVLVLVLS